MFEFLIDFFHNISQYFNLFKINNDTNLNKNLEENSIENVIDYDINVEKLITNQEMTKNFPDKAFNGKINSKTIEIPGLYVKVVRYKNIENGIGKLDPNLYRKYSLRKRDDSSIEISRGKLYFNLRYNEEIQSFSVYIKKAELFRPRKLPSINSNQKLNICVKIQLSDDKKIKFQTKIQQKTSKPVFDETFSFSISFEDLKNRKLFLGLYQFGKMMKHELIGAVRINELHLIKNINNKETELSRNLLQLYEVSVFCCKSFVVIVNF